MSLEKKVLAVDFGASSGRVMLCGFDGQKLGLEELHRFSNDSVFLNRTMYWDFPRLYFEIEQGMLCSKAHGQIDSIGVDTWGVDYGLLDKNGHLLSNPVHYRDQRTNGILSHAAQRVSQKRLYQATGNQVMEINTAFQLFAMARTEQEALDRADSLLMMPDLFNYFLSGQKRAERSIASTTQLLDAENGRWSGEILNALDIPARLLADIVPSGTVLGPLLPEIGQRLGMTVPNVIAVCGHDTQGALVAVPAKEEDFIFISCGTWSLFGTELSAPIVNDTASELNLTNEQGFGGKISFLKNIIGLWLIQESRRQWQREGNSYSFGVLEELAERTQPFQCLIDPDAPEFVPSGNVPERIRNYCRRTGQHIPETEGELVRCIDESLALTYRKTLEEIRRCTGKTYRKIHLVGGGAQSALLCQMTADACGMPVLAGPIEATVLGNAAVQLAAMGELSGLADARRLIADSSIVKEYLPHGNPCCGQDWDDSYGRFQSILKQEGNGYTE